jgi:hypothetical protein
MVDPKQNTELSKEEIKGQSNLSLLILARFAPKTASSELSLALTRSLPWDLFHKTLASCNLQLQVLYEIGPCLAASASPEITPISSVDGVR